MMTGGPDTPLKADSYGADLLAEVPTLARIADVDTRILSSIDSSEMQPERWIEIARTIHGALPDYDGAGLMLLDDQDALHYVGATDGRSAAFEGAHRLRPLFTRELQPAELPDPLNPPPGCAFASRCPAADAKCRDERPPLMAMGAQHAACWHPPGRDG